MAKFPPLIISDKQKSANSPERLPVAFRQIERWVQGVNIAAGGYASLTGPGQTTTPGDLTQAGAFTVNNTTSTTNPGIALNNLTSNGSGIGINNGDTGGITIQITGAGGGIQLLAPTGASGISIWDQSTATSGPGITLESDRNNTDGIYLRTTNIANIVLNTLGGGNINLQSGGHISYQCTAGGSSGIVDLFAYNGNPNGHVTAIQKGDVCFDNVTPGIWLSTAGGNNTWSMYTNP